MYASACAGAPCTSASIICSELCYLQMLGRATNVGAYVKRGEENGYIKIFLRGDTEEEQIIITRKISTQNNSDWLFNGKTLNGWHEVEFRCLSLCSPFTTSFPDDYV